MPKLARPDGVEIHWQERGKGPPVVLANQLIGLPEVFHALIDDLAADHRVVTYHLRGTGLSTRDGPYDMKTDIGDLEALVEGLGSAAVAIGIGDGSNRAVKLAAERPDLILGVVSPGGNPLGRLATEGSEGLAASDSVLEALVAMMDTDYRGGLRTMISGANEQASEDEIRERVARTVDFAPQEATVLRLRTWIRDSALEEALALGKRVWVLLHPGNPWFPVEILERTRELLPEAHVMQAEDGPLSRPDITAGIVRRMTANVATSAQARTT